MKTIRPYLLPLALIAVAQLADVITTHLCGQVEGIYEVNPVARFLISNVGIVGFGFIKVLLFPLMFGLGFAATERLFREGALHRAFVWASSAISVALYIFAAVSNSLLLSRALAST